jgi:hypothetical protein
MEQECEWLAKERPVKSRVRVCRWREQPVQRLWGWNMRGAGSRQGQIERPGDTTVSNLEIFLGIKRFKTGNGKFQSESLGEFCENGPEGKEEARTGRRV